MFYVYIMNIMVRSIGLVHLFTSRDILRTHARYI